MSEELAGSPAPEATPVATPETAPETKADAPEAVTEAAPKDEKDTQMPAETFTKEQMREVAEREFAKATAKAERRAERILRQKLDEIAPRQWQQRQPEAPADDGPDRSQYNSDQEFIKAAVQWELKQRDQEANAVARRNAQQALAQKTESIYAKAEKLPGFDRETFDEIAEHSFTRPLAEAIIESDIPEKLMAYMASNPEEVERITQLSPTGQAKEVGKLELKLANAPKVSNAPPPIKPIGTRGSATNNDPTHQTQAEYEAMRKKQGAHWAR